MTTSTLTLADFLLARIADAEAWAKSQERTNHWHEPFTTARVLAECDAKRRIVELMGLVLESWEANHGRGDRSLWPDVNRRERHHARTIIENLALPYADHEDYDEGWRP